MSSEKPDPRQEEMAEDESTQSKTERAFTADDVARWMFEVFNKRGTLDQEWAASTIAEKFGESFIYENDEGGVSISRAVLRRFRKLTEDTAVWDRSEKYWRRKKAHHKGRLAD